MNGDFYFFRAPAVYADRHVGQVKEIKDKE